MPNYIMYRLPQALEAECLIPLCLANAKTKIILAGDHMQVGVKGGWGPYAGGSGDHMLVGLGTICWWVWGPYAGGAGDHMQVGVRGVW